VDGDGGEVSDRSAGGERQDDGGPVEELAGAGRQS
jgi:hypothetical protein